MWNYFTDLPDQPGLPLDFNIAWEFSWVLSSKCLEMQKSVFATIVLPTVFYQVLLKSAGEDSKTFCRRTMSYSNIMRVTNKTYLGYFVCQSKSEIGPIWGQNKMAALTIAVSSLSIGTNKKGLFDYHFETENTPF